MFEEAEELIALLKSDPVAGVGIAIFAILLLFLVAFVREGAKLAAKHVFTSGSNENQSQSRSIREAWRSRKIFSVARFMVALFLALVIVLLSFDWFASVTCRFLSALNIDGSWCENYLESFPGTGL